MPLARTVPGLKSRTNKYGHNVSAHDVKHIKNIKKNLEDMQDYTTASPMIPIDRIDAANILNLSWAELEAAEIN